MSHQIKILTFHAKNINFSEKIIFKIRKIRFLTILRISDKNLHNFSRKPGWYLYQSQKKLVPHYFSKSVVVDWKTVTMIKFQKIGFKSRDIIPLIFRVDIQNQRQKLNWEATFQSPTRSPTFLSNFRQNFWSIKSKF